MVWRRKFEDDYDFRDPKDIGQEQINHILSLYGRLGEAKGELRAMIGLWRNKDYPAIIILSHQPSELDCLDFSTNGENSPQSSNEISQREEAAIYVCKKLCLIDKLVKECKQKQVIIPLSSFRELESLETLCTILYSTFIRDAPNYNTPERIKSAIQKQRISKAKQ